MEQVQRIKFIIEKKPTVVLIGNETKILRKCVEHLISKELATKQNLIVLEGPEEKIQNFKFYLQKTQFGVLILKEEVKKFNEFLKFLRELPPKNNLIFNFEEKKLRKLKDLVNLHSLSFGMDEKADVFVSSLKLNLGMNLKISFGGAIVPFWLEGVFGKEYILSLLATIAFGILFGMNLVEISRNFSDFEGVPGKKRLIKGIFGSLIIDDSNSFEEKEQKEALEILKEISWAKRKICVLDVKSQEEIFELASKVADFIFVFGERDFLKKELNEKILFFDKMEEGIENMKKILRENDVVLILGSQKINFGQIIDNIRKIW